jgi:G6PDH family F420-dependent oxidoreductase
MRLGYFLSSEEHRPSELVRQARLAEDHGFEALCISDHFHPWNDAQGQSPFVWSVIGAIGQVSRLPVLTAVTCPTVRIHPAIIAQAAATSASLLPGGFRLGLGSGEALNEHVTGARWPTAEIRLDMLEEAVHVIRRLLSGERVDHHGVHYVVEDARIYTLPDQDGAGQDGAGQDGAAGPVPISLSGFGPQSIDLAGRIADGFVTTKPSAEDVNAYRTAGGRGPIEAATKVCWAADRDAAVKTAHRLWSTSGVGGELAQVLPSPKHFEQAAELVTEEATASSLPCGPDPQQHADALREYAKAGVDTLYVSQIGPEQDGFFEFFTKEVRPLLSDVLNDGPSDAPRADRAVAWSG